MTYIVSSGALNSTHLLTPDREGSSNSLAEEFHLSSADNVRRLLNFA